MIQIRKSGDRGHFDHGWLKTYHTFSFGDYRDPEHMGFRKLRVINEDWVEPGQGFGEHPHRDMEIITYIVEGELTHGDNMGNGSVIKAGDVQHMTAGSGVIHSEVNDSDHETVHLLQIWIFPNKKGLPPDYSQKTFSDDDKSGKLRLIASGDGRDGSIRINQDVDLYASIIQEGKSVAHELGSGRHAWVQVVKGSIDVNDQPLNRGDGAAISDEGKLAISAGEEAEILLFDLA